MRSTVVEVCGLIWNDLGILACTGISMHGHFHFSPPSEQQPLQLGSKPCICAGQQNALPTEPSQQVLHIHFLILRCWTINDTCWAIDFIPLNGKPRKSVIRAVWALLLANLRGAVRTIRNFWHTTTAEKSNTSSQNRNMKTFRVPGVSRIPAKANKSLCNKPTGRPPIQRPPKMCKTSKMLLTQHSLQIWAARHSSSNSLLQLLLMMSHQKNNKTTMLSNVPQWNCNETRKKV